MVLEHLALVEHEEVLRSMSPFVEENLHFLGNIEKVWQPTDYLPDMAREDWHEQLSAFRESARGVSDEMLVVLVGDMVTEEALPSYSISLNLIAQDYEGDSDKPWAKWMRGWTAEENRHGDLLNAYLRLTGRVDMRSVEKTIHYLLARGFNPHAYPDVYSGLIYTSFQERATKISHGNAGRMAAAQGDAALGRICLRIAGEESRHETFYTKMMKHVLEVDPCGGINAIREMLRTLIAMPGRLMYDGHDPNLFDHFAVVAQRLGVYTVHDYASIIEHLVAEWDIAGMRVSGKAAKAQDFLCRQSQRFQGLATAVAEHNAKQPAMGFSWINGRCA